MKLYVLTNPNFVGDNNQLLGISKAYSLCKSFLLISRIHIHVVIVTRLTTLKGNDFEGLCLNFSQ